MCASRKKDFTEQEILVLQAIVDSGGIPQAARSLSTDIRHISTFLTAIETRYHVKGMVAVLVLAYRAGVVR